MAASDLSGLVGKHIVYTYSNGWQYELYYKNENTIDYRVISGIVGGRCVKGQKVHMRQLDGHQYMVNWTEPTGTSVSQVLDFQKLEINTVIFFPRWVKDDPGKTICFQNDHIDRMRCYRDVGPTYPIHVVNDRGRIDFMEYCGADNEDVVRKDERPVTREKGHPEASNHQDANVRAVECSAQPTKIPMGE